MHVVDHVVVQQQRGVADDVASDGDGVQVREGGWWWWLRRPRPPRGGGADVRAYIVGIESETFSSAVTFQLDVTVFHCV